MADGFQIGEISRELQQDSPLARNGKNANRRNWHINVKQ